MTSEDAVPCFCIWSDLLGFGAAFQEGGWSFDSEASQQNIQRLRSLKNSFYTSNDPRKEVAVLLNDGLARTYDLPCSDTDATGFLWWLHSALSNHWIVNANDSERGWPGMRSVLAFGERVASWPDQKTWGDHFIGNTNLKLQADQKICIYSPVEFQLNLAFSKAYLIESYGARAGLCGAGLFIDSEALDAIECFLTGGSFKYLQPAETIELPNGGILNFDEIEVGYAVRRKNADGLFRFEIVRCIRQQEVLIVAIEFEIEPIYFSERGLNTKLFRVKRFKPIDEAEPFYFDFDSYAFEHQELAI